MSVKVRFAPSPTGYLHVGNARTALITWPHGEGLRAKRWRKVDDADRQDGPEDHLPDDLEPAANKAVPRQRQEVDHRIDRVDVVRDQDLQATCADDVQ